MKLSHVKGWDGEDQLITDRPTETFIAEFVNSLDWNDFNAVHLAKDEHNWINVSGNVSPDGLSIVYEEKGISHVSDEAPESIEQLIRALQLYLKGNDKFKEFGLDIIGQPVEKSGNTISDEEWLAQYERRQGKTIQLSKLGVIVAITITLMLSTYLYLSITQEIKFIGRQTESRIAIVTSIRNKPTRGGFHQLVAYEFEYEGSKYQGQFRGTRFTGMHDTDDRIKVKFVLEDPSISKRLSTYKRFMNGMFLERWKSVGEEHIIADESLKANYDFGSAAFDFLFVTGMPSEFGELNFDYLKEDKLQTVNEMWELEDSGYDKYLAIGFNGSGDPIALNQENQELVYLNHDNYFEEVFINSDLKRFALTVLRVEEFNAKLTKISPDSFYKHDFNDEDYEKLKDDLRKIDSAIFEEPDTQWVAHLETTKWFRDDERRELMEKN